MFGKIISVLFLSVSFAAECYIDLVLPESEIVVGDTIEFFIGLDTQEEPIVAYSFYLNIDPSIFETIFIYEEAYPFIPVNMDISMQIIQNDTLSSSQMVFKAWEAVEPLVGSGVVAYFSFLVKAIPQNEDNSTLIDFEYNDVGQRTEYYTVREDGNYETHQFSSLNSKTINIQGYDIFPEIPDSSIIPGDTLNIYLNDYFLSEVYSATDALWSFSSIDSLSGVIATIDNDNNILTVTSESNSHGILYGQLTLSVGGIELQIFQDWSIIIDHPIEFLPNLSRINLFEDDTLFLPTDSLFYNIDDRGDLITIDYYIISQSELELYYNNNDTIAFYSVPDWYGPGNIYFSVTESLGRTVVDTIDFQVLNVDDPMELNFYGISGDTTMKDSLTLYHNTPLDINLQPFVTDIDDNYFRWSFEPSENIFIDSVSNNIFRMTYFTGISENIFVGNTSLKVTVTDFDNEASAVDTIQLNIRSSIPQLLIVDPLLVHADSLFTLSLDSTTFFDEDTPDSLLIWEFSFQTMEGTQDDHIYFDYSSASNLLTIDSSHPVNSQGIIFITISENFDYGNVIIYEVPVFYFALNAPQILITEMIQTYTDTLLAMLDLDTLVFDYNYPPESINWSFEGGDSLESVYIDSSLGNILFIQTNSSFVGQDTIKLTATNADLLSDISDVVVNVIPLYPYPQIIDLPDLTVYWHSQSILFDLDDYLVDVSNFDEDIEWTMSYDVDVIDLSINNGNEVLMTSSDLTGNVSIVFIAENSLGYSTSDTVLVLIVQDESPSWDPLLNIEMSRLSLRDTLSYKLKDKCDDDLTTSGDLLFDVETDTTLLKIILDSKTNVILELQDISFVDTVTTITFSAEDEHYNISVSNSITLNILNGFAPEWGSLPLFSFGNDTSFLSGCLNEWCEDPDTPDSLLKFTIESASADLHAEVIEDSGCSSLWLVPITEMHGTYFLILRAEDPQFNNSSKLVIVTVSDEILPEADLSYYITPGLNRRLHYILTSDGSIADFTNSFFLDDSLFGSLSFSLIDQQPEFQLWNSSYKFLESGIYDLIVFLTDNSNNTMIDSLSLSVSLPVSDGGTLRSPSGKVLVQYPKIDYSSNHFIILEESNYQGELLLNNMQTLYSIKSNISSDISFVATFSGETDGSDYYSFYTVFEGEDIPVPTFIDKNGNFQASVALNSHFYFGRSLKRAQSIILPQEHMYCYPNPFNSSINIMYFMPVANLVKVSIYNILGEQVYTNEYKTVSGLMSLNWDGRDNNGQTLPAGLYFYHLSEGEKQLTRKITILK